MAVQNRQIHPRYQIKAHPNGLGSNSASTPSAVADHQAVTHTSAPAPKVTTPLGTKPIKRQATTYTSDPAPKAATFGQEIRHDAITSTSAPAPDIWVPKVPTPESDGAGAPTPDSETYQPGYYEQQAVQPALGAMRAAAAGESPVDRRIANLYLGYLRAGNQAEKASAAHEMAQLGVSPQAAAARMAMMGQQQGSQEAQTAGQLAVQSQQRAFDASRQLGTLGMQGAGLEQQKHEFDETMDYKWDVLGEDTRQFDETHEENIRQFNERQELLRDQEGNEEFWAQYDAAIQVGDYERAQQLYQEKFGEAIDLSTLKDAEARRLRNELMPQVENRIGVLINASKGFDAIVNDQQAREALAEALNEDINSDAIDTELRNLYDATLASNQGAAASNLSNHLHRASLKGWDADTAVNDDEMWREAGYSRGLDPYDLKNAEEIEEHIRDEYKAYNKSAVDDMVDTAMTEFSLYTDTPGAEADLRKVVTDAYGTAITTNAEGGMVINDDVFWPWENPETRFNYVGWDGQDLNFKDDGSLTLESQQLMQETVYTTGDGQPVTAQAAIDKWGNMTSTERSQFVNDDGSINKDAFLASEHGFGTAKSLTGSTIHTSIDYWDQFMFDNPDLLNEFDADTLPGLATLELGGGGDENDPTVFAYHNTYGDKKEGAVNGNLLPRIYFQFREVFGEDLTARQFADLWNEGDGWLVAENGLVKNFDPQWRQQSELPEAGDSPSSYRLNTFEMDEFRERVKPPVLEQEPDEPPRVDPRAF